MAKKLTKGKGKSPKLAPKAYSNKTGIMQEVPSKKPSKGPASRRR